MQGWEQFAMLWGPAVPLALILIYGHWYVLYRFLPKAARRIERLIVRLEQRSEERHVQFLAAVELLHRDLRPILTDRAASGRKAKTPKQAPAPRSSPRAKRKGTSRGRDRGHV